MIKLPSLALLLLACISLKGAAAFTSITQWNWGEGEELWLGDRLLNVGKRDAYFRYLNVPKLTNIPLELAANISDDDITGDKELITSNGWRLVSPHDIAQTPLAYQRYILSSKGEFGCAKPIHADLKTGWISDRTAAFLASGRPAIVEDTGAPDLTDDNFGLMKFRTVEEAVDRLHECIKYYDDNAHAARSVAEDQFNSNVVLPQLVEISAK